MPLYPRQALRNMTIYVGAWKRRARRQGLTCANDGGMRLEQRQLSRQKKLRRAVGNGHICFRKCCLADSQESRRI